ncbi:MAG: hypothetical protein EPO20_14820 [Betaproteobacteria bacterium]|nr:MAG: hypothetical protein EPO20_14820 [Betaproteobacteria bacterium]
MNDDLHRMVGEVGGKVDSLTTMMRDYIEAHDKRHEKIDDQIAQAHADLNQAKGAKAALLAMAGGLAGLVALVVAAAERLLTRGG